MVNYWLQFAVLQFIAILNSITMYGQFTGVIGSFLARIDTIIPLVILCGIFAFKIFMTELKENADGRGWNDSELELIRRRARVMESFTDQQLAQTEFVIGVGHRKNSSEGMLGFGNQSHTTRNFLSGGTQSAGGGSKKQGFSMAKLARELSGSSVGSKEVSKRKEKFNAGSHRMENVSVHADSERDNLPALCDINVDPSGNINGAHDVGLEMVPLGIVDDSVDLNLTSKSMAERLRDLNLTADDVYEALYGFDLASGMNDLGRSSLFDLSVSQIDGVSNAERVQIDMDDVTLSNPTRGLGLSTETLDVLLGNSTFEHNREANIEDVHSPGSVETQLLWPGFDELVGFDTMVLEQLGSTNEHVFEEQKRLNMERHDRVWNVADKLDLNCYCDEARRKRVWNVADKIWVKKRLEGSHSAENDGVQENDGAVQAMNSVASTARSDNSSRSSSKTSNRSSTSLKKLDSKDNRKSGARNVIANLANKDGVSSQAGRVSQKMQKQKSDGKEKAREAAKKRVEEQVEHERKEKGLTTSKELGSKGLRSRKSDKTEDRQEGAGKKELAASDKMKSGQKQHATQNQSRGDQLKDSARMQALLEAKVEADRDRMSQINIAAADLLRFRRENWRTLGLNTAAKGLLVCVLLVGQSLGMLQQRVSAATPNTGIWASAGEAFMVFLFFSVLAFEKCLQKE